jgi:hypothetical protein
MKMNDVSLPYLFSKKFKLLLEGDALSYAVLPEASTLLEIRRKYIYIILGKNSRSNKSQQMALIICFGVITKQMP